MSEKLSVWDLLQKRYPSAEYALMAEVSDGAGFSRSRSADYMVMNLWPSRGLSLTGIELKSSRTDWLRELKNPQKAENIFSYCDFFWLLTESEDVAKIEEIPANWGWLNIKGNRILTLKEAPKLNPCTLDRSFLAALLKRACNKNDWVHTSKIQERLDQAKQSGIDSAKYSIQRAEDELRTTLKNVKEFEEASGIKIDSGSYRHYVDNKRLGEIVKHLYNKGSVEELTKEFERLEATAKIIHQRISDGITLVKNSTEQKEAV